MPYRLVAVVGSLLGLICLAASLSAADFRIESKVYSGDEEAAPHTYLTLFHHGVVYDFRGEPAKEVIIYDPRQGHFTLLDVQRKVKTRIRPDVLLQFVAGIAARASERGDAIHREAADPKFKIEADNGQHRISLEGKRIEYVATCEASFPSNEEARSYFEFADMYTRLNATQPGELPPQARLAVNAELAQRGWMPVNVEKKLQPGRRLFGRTDTARSEHNVAWQLLDGDQRRIDTAARQQSDFQAVSFAEYRGLK